MYTDGPNALFHHRHRLPIRRQFIRVMSAIAHAMCAIHRRAASKFIHMSQTTPLCHRIRAPSTHTCTRRSHRTQRTRCMGLLMTGIRRRTVAHRMAIPHRGNRRPLSIYIRAPIHIQRHMGSRAKWFQHFQPMASLQRRSTAGQDIWTSCLIIWVMCVCERRFW